MFVSSKSYHCRTMFSRYQNSVLSNGSPINQRTDSAAIRTFSTEPPKINSNVLMIFPSPVAQKIEEEFNSLNDQKYISELEFAASNGDQSAVYQLSLCFSHGKYGLKKNKVLALDLLEKAAKKHYPLAMNDLGVIYIFGNDMIEKVNTSFGASLVIMAAHMDCPDAVMNLGMLYELGAGVAYSLDNALKWYLRAKELGDEYAQEAINRVEYKKQIIRLIQEYLRGGNRF